LAAANSGSWRRGSDKQLLSFRTPWTQTAFGIMVAAMCAMTVPLLVLATPNAPPLILAWIMSVLSGGAGLILLWICSPQEMGIDLRERTYCCKRRWLTFRQEALPRPLADFSGVCALHQGTLLLVFQKRRGLLYGLTLGKFADLSQAQEQAAQFSENTGLPVVDVPWRKRVQRFIE
jgi:hypothetical protein